MTARLILPQSITIREIVDKGADSIVASKANFAKTYQKFKTQVNLVITDCPRPVARTTKLYRLALQVHSKNQFCLQKSAVLFFLQY